MTSRRSTCCVSACSYWLMRHGGMAAYFEVRMLKKQKNKKTTKKNSHAPWATHCGSQAWDARIAYNKTIGPGGARAIPPRSRLLCVVSRFQGGEKVCGWSPTTPVMEIQSWIKTKKCLVTSSFFFIFRKKMNNEDFKNQSRRFDHQAR